MSGRRLAAFAPAAALAAFSLLAAACGGGAPGVASVTSSSTAHASRSSAAGTQAEALLLATRCLRQHGLTNLPDPSIATNGPAKGQLILSKQALRSFPDSVVTRALAACNADLARAGLEGGSSSGPTPQQLRDGLAFARCVRHHGIAGFPDPNGKGQFDLAGTGINSHALTPAQLAAARACLSAAHGTIHIPQQTGASGNS